MTAEMFAIDEVRRCTSVQFYDLTNTDDLLKAPPPHYFPLFALSPASHSPTSPPVFFPYWLTTFALILFPTNNFPTFQTLPPPGPRR